MVQEEETTPLKYFVVQLTMEIEDILFEKDFRITSDPLSLSDTKDLDLVVDQVLKGNWDNVSLTLSSWQIGQLEELRSSAGIRCLITMWFDNQRDLLQGNKMTRMRS